MPKRSAGPHEENPALVSYYSYYFLITPTGLQKKMGSMETRLDALYFNFMRF